MTLESVDANKGTKKGMRRNWLGEVMLNLVSDRLIWYIKSHTRGCAVLALAPHLTLREAGRM